MLIEWNEQTFRWWEDASDYTGYDRAMASLLEERLTGCRTLCDMGCGMALADLELAPKMDRITCVDLSQAVLDYVRERAEEKGLWNLETLHADGRTVEGRWDAVTALFHGTAEEITVPYLRLCRDRLILVTHGSAYGETGPKKYRVRKCADVESTRQWLDARGFRYDLALEALEFGQPHRSLEEAVAFTRAYSRNAPEAELLAHVRRTVRETGREDFPLYTPKLRKFGIFTIRRNDNEHLS